MIVGIFLLYIKTLLIKVQLEFTVLNGQNQMHDLNYKQKSTALSYRPGYWMNPSFTHYSLSNSVCKS